MIKLSTKYEVTMITHYNDVKCDAKCRNWGRCGRL